MGALILLILVILLIPILSIVLDSSLGQALARRLDRGETFRGSGEVTQERIAYLEDELERLAGEVHRLDEESRFLQKLLADRPDPSALPETTSPEEEDDRD